MQNLRSGNTRSSGKAENASLEREISMQFALNNAAKKLTDEDLK
jgi:hypothetical protein